MFAVFVIDDYDNYVPISYGDSELECSLWLDEHSFFKDNCKWFIGVVTDFTF